MALIDNKQYIGMMEKMYQNFPYWEKLQGKTLFLSGATGMICSFLIDALMLYNRTQPPDAQCRIIAAGRNKEVAEQRFQAWIGSPVFSFVQYDVSTPLGELPQEPDYWIHGASTTHPIAYSTEPVNTIFANVWGTRHLLDKAAKRAGSRFLLLSSVEIYGQNRGDTEYFTEDYCGYLDCNTLRAGYPEGKRVSEALCQAYIAQEGVDALIIRLPRCYGPTMRMSDSKAIAQFLKNGIWGENIILKSTGDQHYSFAYVPDAVSGLLWVLTCGRTGQAYNLGDERSDITQRELAGKIAEYAGTEVIFELPSDVERIGYSTATKALMDAGKLRALGWRARYGIAEGITETIDILKQEIIRDACNPLEMQYRGKCI